MNSAPRIHDAAAKGFAAGAQIYVLGRPEYPLALEGWLRDALGLRPGALALDLGAGTGKFAPRLRATGAKIIAVEPVADMRRALSAAHPDVVAVNGTAEAIPLLAASVDALTCAQAFHWFANPRALGEMRRVLRKGGVLIATIPFSARVHHAPYDFHRFTRYRLLKMFNAFESTSVVERGNDFTVIANKMIVVCMRLAKNAARLRDLSLLGLLVFALPTLAALALAHVSLALSFGSRADPLGYGVEAIKG